MRACFWTGILLLLVCPSAFGQYTEDPPPVDSPYWWTLTDKITPEELMRQLQDPAENRRRYREAMEAGRKPRVSEERLAQVTICLDGGLTPELTPMGDAFDAWTTNFRGRGTGYPEAATDLGQAGISRAGVETILSMTHQHLRYLDALREELGPKQRAFAGILGQAKPVLGESFKQARDSLDIATFAQISGRTEAEVAELVAAWVRDPVLEAGVESIQQLKLELSGEDWERLRVFLLTEVAPGMSAVGFEEEG